MAGRTKNMIAAIVALAAATSPSIAIAADFAEVTSGRWRIWARTDCWMETTLSDGTEVSLSTSSKRDDHQLYVRVANGDWTSLTTDSRPPLRIQFGSVDFSGNGFGSGKAEYSLPSASIFVGGSKDAYLGELKVAPMLRVSTGDRVLAELALSGDRAALGHLERCTTVKRVRPDPFAKSTSDPFK